jgi:hypothetical protein
VEVALRGVSTMLAVTEWPRLPAEVRQALTTAEDFRPTVAQTIRDIESATPRSYAGPESRRPPHRVEIYCISAKIK